MILHKIVCDTTQNSSWYCTKYFVVLHEIVRNSTRKFVKLEVIRIVSQTILFSISESLLHLISFLTVPGWLWHVQVNKVKSLGPGELVVHLAGLLIWLVSLLLSAGLSVLFFLLRLMRGQLGKEEADNKEMEVLRSKKKSKWIVFLNFVSSGEDSDLDLININLCVESLTKVESKESGGLPGRMISSTKTFYFKLPVSRYCRPPPPSRPLILSPAKTCRFGANGWKNHSQNLVIIFSNILA